MCSASPEGYSVAMACSSLRLVHLEKISHPISRGVAEKHGSAPQIIARQEFSNKSCLLAAPPARNDVNSCLFHVAKCLIFLAGSVLVISPFAKPQDIKLLLFFKKNNHSAWHNSRIYQPMQLHPVSVRG
jgi:hypothetical protein